MFAINSEMTTAKAIISAAASAAATAMLLRTISQEYVPTELRDYIYIKIRNLFTCFSSELTLIIEEYDSLNSNHLFQAAELYLEPIIPPNTKRLKISLPRKESNVSFSLERDQEIIDTFNGVTLKWRFVSRKTDVKYINDPDDRYHSVPVTEDRLFELSFHKKHKKMVTESYIKYVIEKSKEIKNKKKTLKLFTLGMNRMSGSRDVWQPVNLEHPAKFDSLAMDMEVKKKIMEDLDRFVRRKEFYKRVGKAWKRGYLLFGPPGTGKSSLIAAMANYLNFDIYDLELTDLRANSDLRNILISTGNKSILVVEDIDCSLDLQMDRITEARAFNAGHSHGTYRDNQVTLSGLLNFVDGLWSSCGDERIIIFTTNHKEKLDPALLRPGRMDVHIHMSYCTACGFRMLASNYLGIKEHPLFVEIEGLIEITKVTPAEIAEHLMKSEEPETALRGLIEFIERKGIEDEERKKRESEESRVKAEESKVAEAQGGEQGIMCNGVSV